MLGDIHHHDDDNDDNHNDVQLEMIIMSVLIKTNRTSQTNIRIELP